MLLVYAIIFVFLINIFISSAKRLCTLFPQIFCPSVAKCSHLVNTSGLFNYFCLKKIAWHVSFCPQIWLSVHLLLKFHILIIYFKTTGDIGIQLRMNDVCRVFYKYSSICYEMAQKKNNQKTCNSYF